MDEGTGHHGVHATRSQPIGADSHPPSHSDEPEVPRSPSSHGQQQQQVHDEQSHLFGAALSMSPTDDHPSSSSTSSSPQSCSFSSTTGLEASESATSQSTSSVNSDGDWESSRGTRIPTSFSTATLRAALEAVDPAPHKSASLPLTLPHPPAPRARLQHSASEPIPIASSTVSRPATLEEEKTPIPDAHGRAFVFPPPLPPKDHFVRDPVASDLNPFSPTSHSPNTSSRSPPTTVSHLTSRPPPIHHRKTHSGAASSGGFSSSSGIHKRLPSASSKPLSVHVGGGGSNNAAALKEAGLRVHDFRPAPGDVTPVVHEALGTKSASINAEGKRQAQALSPGTLADRLERGQLLVVDVRSLSAFLGQGGRVRGSINVNFPTLLIKRFRKGNSASFSLSSFVTTEAGKSLLQMSAQQQQEDVVVVDDRLETRDPNSLNPGSVLLSVLERRDDKGEVYYLDRPLGRAVEEEPRLRRWIVEGEGEDELSGSSATGSEDEFDARAGNFQPGLQPINLSSHGSMAPPRLSPLPRTPTNAIALGPPSLTPPKTPGGTPRARPPKLRRIDTSENLLGTRKHTPSTHRAPSRSPNAPQLRVDAESANARGGTTSGMSLQAICHMQAKSPAATATRFAEAELTLPPQSAYPSTNGDHSSDSSSPDEPRTGVADVPPFIVSCIIPGFLYLGPEPTRSDDLDELESLGVKVVLNLALECEDKNGEVGRRFEWRKIGMRDFVEETGVQRAMEQACRILADAQLQGKPVYVHCRAGKSRSVTIVLAWLVHRNHWSLKRAYAHVSERRKGISPNIGFVAELMTWEERERGRKSSGVFGSSSSAHPSHSSSSSASSSAASSPPATAPAPINPSSHPFTSMVRSSSDQGGAMRPGHAHSQSSFAGMRYHSAQGGGGLGSPAFSPTSQQQGKGRGEERMGEGDGRERRAADGTWAEQRGEEHDESSNPQRRASRAGLESFAFNRLGD